MLPPVLELSHVCIMIMTDIQRDSRICCINRRGCKPTDSSLGSQHTNRHSHFFRTQRTPLRRSARERRRCQRRSAAPPWVLHALPKQTTGRAEQQIKIMVTQAVGCKRRGGLRAHVLLDRQLYLLRRPFSAEARYDLSSRAHTYEPTHLLLPSAWRTLRRP